MMSFRPLVFAGFLLLTASTGSLCQEFDVGSGEENNTWGATAELAVFSDSLAAFVQEFKDELAPLVVPSATKLKILRGLVGKFLPHLRSKIPEEDYEGFVEDVEAALRLDEEALRVYEAMVDLRSRITQETDPDRLAALRAQMAVYLQQMEGLRRAVDEVTVKSDTQRFYRDMFKNSTIYKLVSGLYDDVVITPFRAYV